MPPPRGINDIVPDWIFKALLSIVGFLLIYMLNQNSAKDDKRDAKLDQIIEQNGGLKSEIMVLKDKLEKIEAQYGDHERRIRELELREARRDGNGK